MDITPVGHLQVLALYLNNMAEAMDALLDMRDDMTPRQRDLVLDLDVVLGDLDHARVEALDSFRETDNEGDD